MANSFDSPPDWLDPNTLAPGARYKAEHQVALAENLNYVHAQGNCQPVLAMGWPTGACKWNGAEVVVLTIAVPRLTDAHTYVYCRFWAKRTASNGVVKFTSANSGNTRTRTVSATTSTRYGGTLDLGVLPAEGDVITMSLTAGAGGVVQVDDVTVEYIALTSPLDAAQVGGFTPLGAGRAAADYPLSTARGRTMLASARDLVARNRCLLNWAGLEGISTYSAHAHPYMPGYGHWAALPTFRGAGAAGRRVTVRALCDSYAGAESRVRVRVGSPDDPQDPDGGTMVVPAAAARAWYETTIRLPEGRKLAGTDYDGTWLGIHPHPHDPAGPPEGYDRSSAKIVSAVAWGY